MRPASDSLRDLVATYRSSLILAEGPAIDFGRDTVSQGSGGHGTHGERGRMHRFGQDVPLCIEMERALDRFVTVWERKVEAAQTGSHAMAAKGDRTSGARKAERAAVLAAEGQSAIEVAYLLGWTEDGVRRLRIGQGLDPADGTRVRRDTVDEAAQGLDPDEAAVLRGRVSRPVTAPARTQLQSATHTTPEEDPCP